MQRFNLLFFLLVAQTAIAQRYNKLEMCGRDTVIVKNYGKKLALYHDTVIEYNAVKCTKVTSLGFRVEVSMSQYYNNRSTKEWMGNYKSGNIGISIPYKDLSIGIRFFKMASVHPGKELVFNSGPLPKNKILNPVKVDYFASYSINFKPNISVEPFVGVTGNYFHVIDQGNPSATYSLSRVFGLNSGLVVNKYFRIKEFEFVSAFAGFNYSTTNFNKIHPALGRGYAEWNIGIAYKGFGKSVYYKKVN